MLPSRRLHAVRQLFAKLSCRRGRCAEFREHGDSGLADSVASKSPQFLKLPLQLQRKLFAFQSDGRGRLIVKWAATLILITVLTGATQAADLSLDQIVKRHATMLERMSRCSVTTHERWLVTRADGSPEQILSTRKCEIRRDGVRANLLVDEVNYPPGTTVEQAGKPGVQGNANEFNYVCGEQVLEVFYPHDKFDVRPPLPRGVMGRLTPQASDEFYVSNAMGHAGIAFGLTSFVSPLSVSRLVGLGKNTVTRDELGYCVQGVAPDGTRHRIWIDPDASFVGATVGRRTGG